MIDQIKFQSRVTHDGRPYERATLWVGGVAFSADITPHTERVMRRIAETAGCDVVDARRSA